MKKSKHTPHGKLVASGKSKIVNPKPTVTTKASMITAPKTKAIARKTIAKAKKGMY